MTDKIQKVDEVRAVMLVDPQALISQAITAGTSIEGMERLLAMRRELKGEWERDQYFAALSLFQKSCPVIKKDKDVMNKDRTTIRYRFAPLDEIVAQVRDLLEANGFSYWIETEQTDKTVTAICKAHHRDGHSESTRFTVPIDPDSFMTAPQKYASALTYAKRYAFCNAFGIMTGDADDDANGADVKPAAKPAAKPAPTKSAGRAAFEKLFREYVAAKCDGDVAKMAAMFQNLTGKKKLDDLTNDELNKVRKDNLDDIKAFEAAGKKAA